MCLMPQQPRRAESTRPDDQKNWRARDRGLLLERVAVGLAHEGKNPLHNMVLHLQLMAEKLTPGAESSRGSPVERHLKSLHDGIGRVDALLKSFGEFASPEHLPPDLGAAIARALQLFAYEARRYSVEVAYEGPATLLVGSESRVLGDLVAHALCACVELARDGGRVRLRLEGTRLQLETEGGLERRDEAQPHLDAARRLAFEAACELSIDAPPGAGARLSLLFVHSR